MVKLAIAALLLPAVFASANRGRERFRHLRSVDSLSTNDTQSTPLGELKNSSITSSNSTFTSSSIITSSSSSSSASETPAPTPAYTYTAPVLTFSPVPSNSAIKSPSYAKLTEQLPTILQHGLEISNHSWELGAYIESLLEVYHPQYTPFQYDPTCAEIPWPAIDVTMASIASVNWTGSPTQDWQNGDLEDYFYGDDEATLHPQPLAPGDGALGDPAALGSATWMVATVADDQEEDFGSHSGNEYAWMAGNQLEYLKRGNVSANGTISQREGSFELWSDMGYMIPPFPAYVGMTTGDSTLLSLALDQWLLETSSMLDTTNDLYRHVNAWDARLWCTGTAWMVGGGIRVVASVRSSECANEMWDKVSQVEDQLHRTFSALFNQLDSDNLVPNYMNQDNATLAVGDASGTALIVASYYRFVQLCPSHRDHKMAKLAEKAFDGVMSFVDESGWLTHVVDPLGKFGWVVYPDDKSLHSPEGQSFLGNMWAARTVAGF